MNQKKKKKTLRKRSTNFNFLEYGVADLQSWLPIRTFNMYHSKGAFRSGLLLVVLVLSLIIAVQGELFQGNPIAPHAEPVAELPPETHVTEPVSSPLGEPTSHQTPSEAHIPTSCQPCLAGNFSGMYRVIGSAQSSQDTIGSAVHHGR